ncbi:MAG: YraN family protein [Patescibacteria group bacterium]
MTRSLGKEGEQMAERYLEKLGYRVLSRNERLVGCEIDLIMKDGEETVFVEVKTRRSHSMGYPEESVTPRKRGHIRRAAEAWLLAHGERPWRVDVVAITWAEGAKPEIAHFIGI